MTSPPARRQARAIAVLAGLGVALVPRAAAIETTSLDLDVAALVGADAIYAQGYTGTRSIIANVEAGHVWSGHQTLGHVAQFFDDPAAVGTFETHATSVGHTIGGRGSNTLQRGIAHGATLWSGAIATSINGNNFNISANSLRGGLAQPLGALGGPVADVVNMSWGASNGSAPYSGSMYLDYAIDAAANRTGSAIVVSTGNDGFGPNRVGSPARGFNTIAVGALGSEFSGYSGLAGFSSAGAVNYVDPITGQSTAGLRPAVDIVAPGENLTLASTAAPNAYLGNRVGTSFAAPIVAGTVGLLNDVAIDRYGRGTATDARVQKAVIMNSATKLNGWNNGQSNQGGVIRTTQALDYGLGAGALDAAAAYTQLTGDTADLAGTSGGEIGSIGWDFASVAQGAPTDFVFSDRLEAGSNLTVTLTWFADAQWDVFDNYSDTSVNAGSHDNLDLQVWTADDAGNAETLIAESINGYDAVEHLSFDIAQTDDYLLRVVWQNELFDTLGDANTEDFAIAWNGQFATPTVAEDDPQEDPIEDAPAVPAPGAALVLLAPVGCRRRRGAD
ncbi:MAG: S8/S53 family peptidase [Planctomycetota bacterium]